MEAESCHKRSVRRKHFFGLFFGRLLLVACTAHGFLALAIHGLNRIGQAGSTSGHHFGMKLPILAVEVAVGFMDEGASLGFLPRHHAVVLVRLANLLLLGASGCFAGLAFDFLRFGGCALKIRIKAGGMF